MHICIWKWGFPSINYLNETKYEIQLRLKASQLFIQMESYLTEQTLSELWHLRIFHPIIYFTSERCVYGPSAWCIPLAFLVWLLFCRCFYWSLQAKTMAEMKERYWMYNSQCCLSIENAAHTTHKTHPCALEHVFLASIGFIFSFSFFQTRIEHRTMCIVRCIFVSSTWALSTFNVYMIVCTCVS